MDNSIDTKVELSVANDAMLFGNNKQDLDNTMDSLINFFTNYSTDTLANEINNRICMIKNIDSSSEQSKIMFNTIVGFSTLVSNKLKELITKRTVKLKENLNNISIEDYNRELRYLAINTSNGLRTFYEENVNMLIDELASDVDNLTKEKISNCLFESIHEKLMGMLSDKFNYSIIIIGNKYQENKKVINGINEKTIK